MTTVSHHFEQRMPIMPSAAGVSDLAHSAEAAMHASRCEDMEREERRWQLEWDRRNVED
jgi:hypothetical protein